MELSTPETIVYVGDRARRYLASMGLSMDLMRLVLAKAHAETATCTELDPPGLPGSIMWGRTNRFLREETQLLDAWKWSNPKGLPHTISPAADLAIVATSGDDNTGVIKDKPSTKYPKGAATIAKVVANQQLSLHDVDEEFPNGDELSSEEAVKIPTWYFLYFLSGEEIRAELSYPRAISENGYIVDWTYRVIIDALKFDNMPQFKDRDNDTAVSAEPIVVPVYRR